MKDSTEMLLKNFPLRATAIGCRYACRTSYRRIYRSWSMSRTSAMAMEGKKYPYTIHHRLAVRNQPQLWHQLNYMER
jgi:hypothetical protein